MPFQRFYISGASMEPAFRHGDKVLVWRWGEIRPGDAVVFFKNGMTMVKRAAKKTGERWLVRGDNLSRSTDSLDFGDVSAADIIGKIALKY